MTRAEMKREIGRGYFGIGIENPKREVNVGSLFRSAHLYGAAFVFTVGPRRYERQGSDTTACQRHIPLLRFETASGARDALNCALVGIELDDRSVPLGEFRHPVQAAYLMGAEDNGLSAEALASCHSLVQIECPAQWSMNVASAGAIVIYDRMMRVQQ